MSLEMLLAQFDCVVKTAEDMEKLNAAILQLAIKGRLTTRNAGDESSKTILENIRAHRKHLLETSHTRRRKKIKPVSQKDTLPFELPDGWVWAKLGELVDFEYGHSLPKKKRDDSGETPVYGSNGIVGFHTEPIVHEPCIVIGRKGSAGAVNLSLEPCWVIDTAFYVVPPKGICLFFLSYLLQSLQLDELGKGIKPGLNRNEAYEIIVALPPLEEQNRIVARVDELLAQTRQLAAELEQANAQRRKVFTSMTHHLTHANGNGPAATWPLLAANFDQLLTDAETVDELKQAILQLAVQGRLVPQDPNDEPASELLERIAAEKKYLVEDGKIRIRKVKSISEKDIPFKLPTGWSFVRLGTVTETVSGVTKGRKLQKHETVVMPYLRVANVQRGFLDLEEIKEIEIKKDEVEKYCLESGDLLLTEGGDADKLGRSAIWRGQIADCIHQNHVFRARPIIPELKAEWLMLCTNSYYGREFFLGAAKQTTNLASINMTQLVNFPLVLPSLNEQNRIMARVDELLALCDRLAGQLTTTCVARKHLLDTILAQAV